MVEKKHYNNDEEDENLQEAEYHKKSDYSQAEQVREAVNKVKEARGKEMKPGFFNITTQPNGSIKKEYVEDTRRAFVGSMEYLKGLLTNEIATSKKAKELIKEFHNKMQKCFNKNCVNASMIQNDRVVILERKYIPEVDEVISVEMLERSNKTYSNYKKIRRIPGYYNNLVKMYWDEVVWIYDFLFMGLNKLIAEKNYFKQQGKY